MGEVGSVRGSWESRKWGREGTRVSGEGLVYLCVLREGPKDVQTHTFSGGVSSEETKVRNLVGRC